MHDDHWDLLTPTKLAEILKTNENTLANWRTSQRGPRFVKVGTSVRYRRSDVDSWIEERTVSDTSEAKALR